MSHALAIDIGTEGARAAVYTDAGVRVGEGRAAYATAYPRPGWAEQEPGDWWASAVLASREALAQAGTAEVAGISVATTSSSVVFLDEQGTPIRSALLWMDARASEESQATAALDHEVLRFSGGSDSSEWLVPKAMWIARHEPETYRRAAMIGEAVDFMTLRLTGAWVGSQLNATCKWNYDARTGALPVSLYEALGVPDLGDRLPSDIRPVGTPIGPITASAADELGIAGRPIVSVGGIDAHLSLVALAGLSANPVSVIAGTSNAFIAELDDPVFDSRIWGPYPQALTDRWLVEGGQVSAGSALTWFAERVIGVGRDGIPQLVAEASRIPPVTHGLLALDNLMGNRTPLRDPMLRGGLLGVSLGTEPAAIYRAMVEAVAYGTRQVLDSFEQVGVDTADVFVAGGISHNPLWLQTTADTLGRPISIVEGENLTLSACGAIALAGVERIAVADAAARFTPAARVVEPTASDASVLAEGYEIYLEAVASTTSTHHRLVALAAGAGVSGDER